jgi:hypothetical protein
MPSWFERYSQPPPASPRPAVERVPVEGAECPACGSSDVRRYPVSNQCGPQIATKCQSCLHTVSIRRPGPDDAWPSYRSVTMDWTPSPIERAKGVVASEGASR